jgi:hypothetical protein
MKARKRKTSKETCLRFVNRIPVRSDRGSEVETWWTCVSRTQHGTRNNTHTRNYRITSNCMDRRWLSELLKINTKARKEINRNSSPLYRSETLILTVIVENRKQSAKNEINKCQRTYSFWEDEDLHLFAITDKSVQSIQSQCQVMNYRPRRTTDKLVDLGSDLL